MTSKKTLNAKNLAALGADRLAGLLLDLSKGNATAKRQLRLELAGEEGPAQVAVEIRKRLTAIARSRSFIDWQGRNVFADDLDQQRCAIVEHVGRSDPKAGFDLIWRFIALANGIYERCDDSTGRVQNVFHTACEDLIDLAEATEPDPTELADRLAEALPGDDYGHYPALITGLAPVLGADGLHHLKSRIRALGRDSPDSYVLRHALEQIADAEGDVDGFIAQQSDRARQVPQIAADIACRLLTAGRIEEAWEAVNAVDTEDRGWIPYEWEVTRIAVLEALDRKEEAQAFQWECFERSLNADHLRACLKRLPDFEDVEAEDRAMQHALGFESFNTALHFLITWPAPEYAAQLVTDRAAEIDGNHYELLGPAADTLEERHPLAVRHLQECEDLATRIKTFAPFADHDAYVAGLRRDHGRKSSFWMEVGG